MQTTTSPVDSADVAVHAERWLGEAYHLVSSGWCQHDAAQDDVGDPIAPPSLFARRWSPTGALQRLLEKTSLDLALALVVYQRAHLALVEAVDDLPAAWNDAPGRTQAEAADALLVAVSLVRFLPHRAGADGRLPP
jgi:hypothetical protein